MLLDRRLFEVAARVVDDRVVLFITVPRGLVNFNLGRRHGERRRVFAVRGARRRRRLLLVQRPVLVRLEVLHGLVAARETLVTPAAPG